MFDYQAYNALLEKIGAVIVSETDAVAKEEAREDLDFTEKAIQSFLHYINTVCVGETTIRFSRISKENEVYRLIAEEADKSRTIAHNAAISSCSLINRIAKSYGVTRIFLGSTDNRYEVAEFCRDVMVQVFDARML